jgi:ABC-type uncharacterized transport system substrate-binding protein
MQIAEKVMKIMSGVPVSQIPFEEVNRAPVVNLKTARQVKIDLPYEIPENGRKNLRTMGCMDGRSPLKTCFTSI